MAGSILIKSKINMEKKSKFRRLLTRIGTVRLSQIWDKFRKPFNFCWKTGLTIFAIVFVIQLGEALVDTSKDHLGLTHYYWGDEDLGKNIEIRHFSNNQAATFNKITDERFSPKVRWISCVPERDSLTVFCDKEGKRDYLNVNTGKVVIDGQYKHAWHFSEGLAAVVADNGKVGFINYENQMVVPPVYDYVSGHDYIFKDGTWYLKKEDKCGLADADMNVIFEAVYDNVRSNGQDNNAYLTLNGVKQLVSFDVDVILPFVIDESFPLEYQTDCEYIDGNNYSLHRYLVKIMVDYGCYGVMDTRSGKMIIPAVYSDITMISKNADG